MILTSKAITDRDLPFFMEVVNESPTWRKWEGIPDQVGIRDIVTLFERYRSLNGEWLVWKSKSHFIGVTFHVLNAPSNEKPWLGTIIVTPEVRNKGWGKKILDELTQLIKAENQTVLFAATPFSEDGWLKFLGKTGFEQIGIEEGEQGTSFMQFARPL